MHLIADDRCRDSRGCDVLWNVFNYHCSCSDSGIRTYGDVFNGANVRTDVNVVAYYGCIAAICSYSGELTEIAVVTYYCGRVYYYTHIMVQQKSETDACGFDNVNIGVLTDSVKHIFCEIVSPASIRR